MYLHKKGGVVQPRCGTSCSVSGDCALVTDGCTICINGQCSNDGGSYVPRKFLRRYNF